MIFLGSIIIFAFIILFSSAVLGCLLGVFFEKNKIYRVLKGFWGGVLLSFMCFSFITEVFYRSGIIYSLIFVFGGIIFSLFYEKYIGNFFVEVILCFFGGIVVGSVFMSCGESFIYSSFFTGLYVMSCIVGGNIRFKLFYSFFMAFSGVISIYLNFCYDKNAEFIYAMSGGAILYVICKDVLPEKITLSEDFFVCCASLIGFIAGIGIFGVNL